jgi:hypothetical protein
MSAEGQLESSGAATSLLHALRVRKSKVDEATRR